MNELTNILNEAAACFSKVRQDLMLGAELLHKISEEELWKGKYSSFGEYVEQECQIGTSMASKLVSIWKHYAIEGGLAAKELQSVDSEKLYLALKLPGTTEERLEKASLWSRNEIRAEISEKEPCTDHVMGCLKCRQRIHETKGN